MQTNISYLAAAARHDKNLQFYDYIQCLIASYLLMSFTILPTLPDDTAYTLFSNDFEYGANFPSTSLEVVSLFLKRIQTSHDQDNSRLTIM